MRNGTSSTRCQLVVDTDWFFFCLYATCHSSCPFHGSFSSSPQGRLAVWSAQNGCCSSFQVLSQARGYLLTSSVVRSTSTPPVLSRLKRRRTGQIPTSWCGTYGWRGRTWMSRKKMNMVKRFQISVFLICYCWAKVSLYICCLIFSNIQEMQDEIPPEIYQGPEGSPKSLQCPSFSLNKN